MGRSTANERAFQTLTYSVPGRRGNTHLVIVERGEGGRPYYRDLCKDGGNRKGCKYSAPADVSCARCVREAKRRVREIVSRVLGEESDELRIVRGVLEQIRGKGKSGDVRLLRFWLGL